MVVCKFFQQGNCRYGQSCRFEHIYGSKYSYHVSQNNPAPAQAATGVTDEQLVNQVQSDIQAALHGGQWLLSGYAPFKEKPALPGLLDMSFEEARLFIYEANTSNNVQQVVAYMNELFREARRRHEQLLQPNPIIINALRSVYEGQSITSPFNNAQDSALLGSNNPATSVFRNAVQSSVFGLGSTPTGFGQNTPSIFNQNTSNDTAKSIFAQAAQGQTPNVFQPNQTGQNVYVNNQMSQNVFGSPSQTNQNVFAQSPNSTTDPAKSIFAQANQSAFASQAQNPASLFASANQQTSAFSQPSPFQTNNVAQHSAPSAFQSVFDQSKTDGEAFSRLEDLCQDDLEAYQNDIFRLGFVPEMPPPQSLCV